MLHREVEERDRELELDRANNEKTEPFQHGCHGNLSTVDGDCYQSIDVCQLYLASMKKSDNVKFYHGRYHA